MSAGFLLATHLARVLSSLQVSSTEHGIGDHARVGVITVPLRQDGEIQALQPVTVSCRMGNKVLEIRFFKVIPYKSGPQSS